MQNHVDYNLGVARHVLEMNGKVSLSNELVGWSAVNQYTKKIIYTKLPEMLVGDTWLKQNDDLKKRTYVIDEITDLVGETATIFQRMNEQGDMLRVATNVESLDGKRAIGTYIPATNPDGTPNPVVSTIMKGDTYHGRAYVVNAWYITTYEPMRNDTGDLIGMLYVGIKQKVVESRIRQAIISYEIGRSGYVYILGGKGEERGSYIISKGGLRDGEELWNVQDNSGNYTIRQIINEATSLQSGELGTIRYRWKNIGEKKERWKIARLAYYEPWDWVIGASAYEDELQAYQSVLSEGRKQMVTIMTFTAIAIILLVGFIGVLVALTIGRPLRKMTQAAETIIEGNLDQTVDIQSRDEIGKLAGAFNTMTTRLRETLDGLSESEKFLNDIIENIPAMIAVKETDDLRYVRFNRAGEKLLGRPREDLIGKTDSDIYPPDKARGLIASERAILLSRKLIDIPEERVTVNATDERILHTKKLPILDGSGNPQYLLSISEDITQSIRVHEERQKLVQQLEHSQRLEAVGRLAGGVAHDFNNILTGINGYCDMLLLSVPKDTESYGDVLTIKQATERAAGLTAQLLAFSRKQISNPKIIDINQLVSDSSAMLRPLIGENIKYEFKPGEDLDPIKVDPGQMEQILVNLVVNARDAMPDGGQLTVRTHRQNISEVDLPEKAEVGAGQYIALSVSDTGTGIAEDKLEHIFEPFFTTKEMGRGTGLGLSTVYGIISQNEGFIDVDSTVGEGTTFTAYFPPVKEEFDYIPTEEIQASLPHGTETILLVEDEEIVRDLATKMLRSFGYTVLAADDDQAAIQICIEHMGKINLLLSDVVLPGMNGLALSEQLKKLRPEMHRMIFMSGYTEDTAALKAVLEKGSHFIAKPFDINALIQKVREVLDQG